MILVGGYRIVEDLAQLRLRLGCRGVVDRGENRLLLDRIVGEVKIVDIEKGLEIPQREENGCRFPDPETAAVPYRQHQQKRDNRAKGTGSKSKGVG